MSESLLASPLQVTGSISSAPATPPPAAQRMGLSPLPAASPSMVPEMAVCKAESTVDLSTVLMEKAVDMKHIE
jgi:hypothetical protein